MVTTQSLFFLLDISVLSNHLVVLMTTKLFGKLRFLMKLASSTSFSVPKNTPRVFHVETTRNTLGVFCRGFSFMLLLMFLFHANGDSGKDATIRSVDILQMSLLSSLNRYYILWPFGEILIYIYQKYWICGCTSSSYTESFLIELGVCLKNTKLLIEIKPI